MFYFLNIIDYSQFFNTKTHEKLLFIQDFK
jgi:hypothetical protein